MIVRVLLLVLLASCGVPSRDGFCDSFCVDRGWDEGRYEQGACVCLVYDDAGVKD